MPAGGKRWLADWKLSRNHTLLALASGGLVLLLILTMAFLALRPGAPVATLQVANVKHVRVDQPLKIHFDREVDLRHVQVALAPPAAVTVKAAGKQDITIVPMKGWEPARR